MYKYHENGNKNIFPILFPRVSSITLLSASFIEDLIDSSMQIEREREREREY